MIRKIFSLFAIALLLSNALLSFVSPGLIIAQEATPSSTEAISPVPSATPTIEPIVSPSPEPTPSPSPVPDSSPTPIVSEPTPTPTSNLVQQESTPTPVPAPVWNSLDGGVFTTINNVVVGEEYAAPQNDKVKIKFTTISGNSGKLFIKEVKLTADQIKQTGSLSDTAYDITSTMADGTFYYDLTLPIPAGDQNKKIEVKSAETTDGISNAQKVSEPEEKAADTITIHGLNHFTVFILTTPNPDTIQRILINEIAPTAVTEWVELYNNGTAAVNLATGTGWVIRNSAGDSQSLATLGTITPAGRAVFNAPVAWLSDTAPETVTILNELGSTIDTVTISLTTPGLAVEHYPLATESVGRKTDGIADWKIFSIPTKGTANTTPIPATGLAEVGPTNETTTFPAWYKDSNGLALDLMEAADPNGIAAPVDADNAFSSQIGFGGEGFWFSADASIPTAAGSADLVQATEASFAPNDFATDGLQSAFARIRIRIDVTDPGTYTVTYPYGQKTYVVSTPGNRAINDTIDIGCFGRASCDSMATPNYSTVLTGEIGPFLTWDTFNTNPALSDPLLINATTGRRYVGLGTTDHAVKGSPTGNNFFRVTGPNIGGPGVNSVQTTLFTVTGRLADASAPVITLFGANPVNVNQGAVYADAGATAIDDLGGNLTGSIAVTGLPVDTSTLGAKTVTYTVTDGAGRTSAATRTVNVVVAGGVDNTAPVITLLGTTPVSVVTGTVYTDAGATALDNADGDITASIVTVNPVNTAITGTYIVTYNISDAAGNAATPVTRTVNVVADTVAPVITVTGSNPVNVFTGATYTDAGATATDNVDGNLTALIVATGLPIDTTIVGANTVTYTVADAAGNTAVSTRTVNIANALPAGLVQTGPVNPTTGFPSWYKDSNGLALNLMEADDAFGISDPVDPANPDSVQIGFNAEGFWWSAEASIDNGTQTGLLVLAIEAVFAGEAAVDGEQSVQNRLRYRIDGLVPGETYTVTHPFGSIDEVADSAGVINVTDDIGCFDTGAGVTCNQVATPNFSTALSGQVGPYLTWTTFNTNPALTDPQLTNPANPGRRYVGNPAVEHAVTGSPTGNNLFRVTGPNVGGPGVNSIETSLFLVSGRLADGTAPVITRNGTSPVEVAQNAVYTDAGATALDDFDGIVPVVTTGVPVDTATTGAKTITYTATDRAGNTATATRTVNVNGIDITAPVITLLGTNPVSVTVGSAYADAGATALDNIDGNITANIVTTNPVNTAVIGAYTVTYAVSDAALNFASATRTVNVVAAPPVADTTAPVITSLGISPVEVTVGGTYTDAGATASDNIDGNITASIVTTNPVNTAVIGAYTVTYNVSDAAGNAAIPMTRTVNVVAAVQTTASIAGLVFQDINANRVKDAGEPALPGWTLFLDTNNNKALDTGETSTVSDGAGNYQFLSLLPGTYNINEVVQTNWAIRLPGGNGYTQAVIAGDNITGKDFGNIATQTVGGQGGFATTTGTNLTSSVVAVADSVINVSSNGGTSKVTIPADTIITASTGEVFDASFLAASDPAGALISGLGSGVALKGKLQWGIPNLGLVFSTPITLDIFVGTALNGQTLNVQRSVDGTTNWTSDGIVAPAKCTVTAGICSFQATKASYYIAADIPEAATDDSSNNNNSISGAPVCNDAKPGSAPVLSIASKSENEVTLSWTKAADPVTYYLLAYGTSSGNMQFGNPNIGDKNTTSFSVKGLSGGTTYFFQVRAGNGCMPGDYSNEVTVTPLGPELQNSIPGFIQGVLGTTTDDKKIENKAITQANVLGISGEHKRQPFLDYLKTQKLLLSILIIASLALVFNLCKRIFSLDN